MEAPVLRFIAQFRPAGFHGADAAEYVFEYLAAVLYVSASALAGHVVGVESHEDEVVPVLHVQRLDDGFVESVPERRVFQFCFPKLGEKPVLLAVHDLLCGEGQVQKISAQSAGEGFLQQGQVFFRLLFGQQAQRFIQVGDYLPVSVDVAAIDIADAVPLGADAAANFIQFFLVHGVKRSFRRKYKPERAKGKE